MSTQRIKQAFNAVLDLGNNPSTESVQELLKKLSPEEQNDVLTLLRDETTLGDSFLRVTNIGLLAAGAHSPDVMPQGTILDNTSDLFKDMNPPLPPFEILGPFASGGQAQLYKARSKRPINGTYLDPETVVLKVIRDSGTILSEATLFHAALLLNGINDTDFHPSLYLDAEKDVAFYAMPQFDIDLASFLKHEPDLGTKLNILYLLAMFIDKIHPVIIHRDIKPTNILLRISSRGEVEQVVLADFGIARLRPGMFRAACRFLRALRIISATPSLPKASIAYTPGYAAPEAAVSSEATVLMDTYSFAVTAYEMIVGRLPKASDFSSIQPLVRRNRPRSLEQLFGQALADDPGIRYISCLGMMYDLAALLNSSLTLPFMPDRPNNYVGFRDTSWEESRELQ